jgi:hypothetical protein
MNNDFVINTWDVLDYVANGGAGLGDGVTFGYLNDAREYLGINNGIDQTSVIYTAGLYTGTAVGMGISGGAGGGAAATGWAVRTGRVYVMAGRADEVGTTAANILSGNVSLSDGMSIASALPRSRVTRQLGVSRASAAGPIDTIPEGRRLIPYWPPNRGFANTPVPLTLQPGTRIDRYGFDGGRFASPEGVPVQSRSLAPGTADRPYSVFDVVEPVDVLAGNAAPWFGQPGGGMQYELAKTTKELLDAGIIRRVNP